MPRPMNLLDLVKSGAALSGIDRKVFKSASIYPKLWKRYSKYQYNPLSREVYDETYKKIDDFAKILGFHGNEWPMQQDAIDHENRCWEMFPIGADNDKRQDCISKVWTDIYPKFIPTGDMIRMDPLLYTEHFNKYVRDYARSLMF